MFHVFVFFSVFTSISKTFWTLLVPISFLNYRRHSGNIAHICHGTSRVFGREKFVGFSESTPQSVGFPMETRFGGFSRKARQWRMSKEVGWLHQKVSFATYCCAWLSRFCFGQCFARFRVGNSWFVFCLNCLFKISVGDCRSVTNFSLTRFLKLPDLLTVFNYLIRSFQKHFFSLFRECYKCS